MRATVIARAGLPAGLIFGLVCGPVLGPAARADELDLDLTPNRAAPGQEITIEGACDRNTDNRVSFVSTALEAGPANINADGQFSVTGTVNYDAEPGRSYRLTAICNRSQSTETTSFYVKGDGRGTSTSYPDGGAMTGGGGTAGQRVPIGWTSAGLALVLAGGVAGGVAVRRARSRGRP